MAKSARRLTTSLSRGNNESALLDMRQFPA